MVRGGARGVGRTTRFAVSRGAAALRKASPEELVRLCLASQEGAWEEFLRRYANLIYSTIHQKVGLSASDRDDAFQNTVMTIYENLSRLRDPERIVSWIVQISYRQGVNRVRSRVRAREMPIEELTPTALHESVELVDGSDPPDEVQADLERAQRAQELIDLLPEKCRRLLQLLFYEDPAPDYAEVARRVPMPIGSIGPTRARCLAKMRRLWEERGWMA